jgi:integrase
MSAAALSDAQLIALIGAAKARNRSTALRDRAVLALLANTGIKPAELVALERRDCIPTGENPRIRVRRRGVASWLPISPALGALLALYARHRVRGSDTDAAALFPISTRMVRHIFGTYAKLAGLPPGLHALSLRHTAAMRLLRSSGGDARFVQRMLGLKGLRTAAAYLELDPELARSRIDELAAVV